MRWVRRPQADNLVGGEYEIKLHAKHVPAALCRRADMAGQEWEWQAAIIQLIGMDARGRIVLRQRVLCGQRQS
jgi:hypothetical protein